MNLQKYNVSVTTFLVIKNTCIIIIIIIIIYSKVNSASVQIYPKLYANQQMLPIVQHNESFIYLCRYFNYEMDNSDHKYWLVSETERL